MSCVALRRRAAASCEASWGTVVGVDSDSRGGVAPLERRACAQRGSQCQMRGRDKAGTLFSTTTGAPIGNTRGEELRDALLASKIFC